jgi:hypothetical protein
MNEGILRNGDLEVGRVTGQVILPLDGSFHSFPEPGSYFFQPPQMPGELPDEIIVETMGQVDAQALVGSLNVPEQWRFVPEELVANLTLEAILTFEAVVADEEYRLNEPNDLEDARSRFEGRWKLVVPFALGFGFARDETQLSLDRRDFELDGRFGRMQRES